MKFDPTHKVVVDSMTKAEAKAFVKFLYSEILRHVEDIQQADNLIKIVKEKFKLE